MKRTCKRFFAVIMLMAMIVTVVSTISAQAASKKIIYGIYKGGTTFVQIGIDKRSKKLVMNYDDNDIKTTFHLKKVKKGVYKAKEWESKKWYPSGFFYVYTKGKKITLVWSYGHDDQECSLKLKKKKKYVIR